MIQRRTQKYFLECDDTKEIIYYVFETKVKPFTEYSRIARVDKKDKICNIVEKLLQKGQSYLHHRSHVDNISKVFRLIREAFTGK